jgi:uncharacterized protein DUF2188
MAEGFVHTVRKDGRWCTIIEDQHGSLGETFEKKEEAVEAGRAEARRRQTEHVIHNEDGSIAERNSYGNDPANRPG